MSKQHKLTKEEIEKLLDDLETEYKADLAKAIEKCGKKYRVLGQNPGAHALFCGVVSAN